MIRSPPDLRVDPFLKRCLIKRGRADVIEEVSGREVGASPVTVDIEQSLALGAADLQHVGYELDGDLHTESVAGERRRNLFNLAQSGKRR
jgi:hypothetical protein